MSLNKIEKVRRRLLSQGQKIVNLSSGNPNEWGIFFKSKKVNSFIQKFLASPLAYSPRPFGNYETTLALQNFYNTKSFKVKAENIALTSGTSESYFHLFRILTNINQTNQESKNLKSEILLPRPSYPLFEEIARLSGTKLKYYDLDEKNNWQINSKNIYSVLTPQTKGIVLVTPNNPTGTVLNKKSLQTVLKIAQEDKLSIISDEVFSEYFFDKGKFPHIASLNAPVPIFTLNGISKTYALPGYKLGWIMMNDHVSPEVKEELERSLDALLSTNQITQALLPIILKNGASFIAKTTRQLKENRQIFKKVFANVKEVNYTQCEGRFYIFLKIKNLPIDDETFSIKCMEKTGIFVHPGYFYDYDQSEKYSFNNNYSIYIIISLLPNSIEFKKYLTKIKNFIKEIRML